MLTDQREHFSPSSSLLKPGEIVLWGDSGGMGGATPGCPRHTTTVVTFTILTSDFNIQEGKELRKRFPRRPPPAAAPDLCQLRGPHSCQDKGRLGLGLGNHSLATS